LAAIRLLRRRGRSFGDGLGPSTALLGNKDKRLLERVAPRANKQGHSFGDECVRNSAGAVGLFSEAGSGTVFPTRHPAGEPRNPLMPGDRVRLTWMKSPGFTSKLPADHNSRGDLVLVAGWARCADSVGFAALAA